MANTRNTKSDIIVRRLYARGEWKLESVAHFGGDETNVADLCLLRDENEKPFIPAASIAGAARSFLTQQLLSWAQYKDGLTREPPNIKRLFGGAGENDTMSALIVADATCVSEQIEASIRDGVRVVPESGSAANKAKFDVEVIERGTDFLLELECIIRHGDSNAELTQLFLALLHAFEQGYIRLGARTRRGYGRGKVASWEVRDLNMENQKDVVAWLTGNPWTRDPSKLYPRPLRTDKRRYFRIKADFKLRTSLLIRSSSEDPKAPDSVHLNSSGKPVVPGTSFAGAFRHRASLIADTLCWYKVPGDEDAVSEMFGPVYEQQSTTPQKELWASRMWIEEHLVENVDEAQWQDRVAIDRFTGGSLQSALFNEKPIYPCSLKSATEPNLQLSLTLEEPEEAEIGLLLLTLRDFWHGHAALGGETSNGRGTLQGIQAELEYKHSASPDIKVWNFFLHKDGLMALNEEGLSADDKGLLKSCVDHAKDYSGSPTGSRRTKTKEETIDV